MKKVILFTTLAVALTIVSAQAQMKYEHGITVKKLFIDYHTLNDGATLDFQRWNGGMEVGYTGYFNEKLSIAIPVRTSEIALPESLTTSRFIGFEGQIQYHILGRRHQINPYISAGCGYVLEINDQDDGLDHAVIPAAIGARIAVGRKTDLVGEIGYRYGLEDGRDNLSIGLGFIHRFGKDTVMPAIDTLPEPEVVDTDGDGIPDDEDLCPNEPGLQAFMGCPDTDEDGIPDHEDDCPEQPGPRDLDGCPDSDGDGVADKYDDCPNRPGTVENNGCPEIAPVTDRDGDGIPDEDDLCPDEPGPESANGCPDRDEDGVPNFKDRCPDEPGPASSNGCPDSDGDGVPDIDDRCIDVPGPVSNHGCPEIEEKDQETLDFAVQNVEFDFGKATLRESSFSILNNVADVLKKYPHYDLRITGHTDDVGAEGRNLELSERRARSCYEYLSTRSIPVSRMSYSGMGEARPIADNDTEEGRARNRRVEFDVYVE